MQEHPVATDATETPVRGRAITSMQRPTQSLRGGGGPPLLQYQKSAWCLLYRHRHADIFVNFHIGRKTTVINDLLFTSSTVYLHMNHENENVEMNKLEIDKQK